MFFDVEDYSNSAGFLLAKKQKNENKYQNKTNQRTRTQTRKTLMRNKLFLKFCTFFPCDRTIAECRVKSVECET